MVLTSVLHPGTQLFSSLSALFVLPSHAEIPWCISLFNPDISLKASELSPGTHHFVGQIFKDAGFPPGVLNVIQHRREDAPGVVEVLIAHPATRKINFTGSTPVGSIIAKLAGQHLKPVLLELGGKAPQIVLEDADLQKAAQAAVAGAWAHVLPSVLLIPSKDRFACPPRKSS
jgi:Aldehyde dehydrogenase family